MSQGVVLWERALARRRELAAAVAAFSDDKRIESDETLADDNPVPTGGQDDGLDDLFNNINVEINAEAPEPAYTFKDTADLWLTQSHTALEHVLLSIGLTRDVLPTKHPLLVFGSHRTGLTVPEYYRVEVEQKCWPSHLYSTERLPRRAAAQILASSKTGTSSFPKPTCFEGKTVAVEVPSPLLADNRWIVVWPVLQSFPEREQEEPQWGQVRRVVWCVNGDQIGPQDLLYWLSHFWQGTPVRIALFRAMSFVREEQDVFAQAKVLPNVRRTLEKFNVIKRSPWIVVGP